MKTIKFNLNRNYALMEEGEKVVTLTSVEASPSGNPTDIKVIYTDDKGATIQEKINLDRALWKISAIAQAILNVQDGEEMTPADLCKQLKGKKLRVEVKHNQGSQPREDGTYPTFANVSKILGGVEEQSTSATPTQSENPRSSILAGL